MNYAKRMLMGVGVVVITCDDCGADCTEHGTWTGGGAGASDEYSGESSANGSNGRLVDGAVFLGVDRFRDEWQLHPCYGIHGSRCESVKLVMGHYTSTTTYTEYFLPFMTTSDSSKFVTSQLIRIYVDPGGLFNLNFARPSNFWACSFSATGHYVTQ
jgi:hypothetical protein